MILLEKIYLYKICVMFGEVLEFLVVLGCVVIATSCGEAEALQNLLRFSKDLLQKNENGALEGKRVDLCRIN